MSERKEIQVLSQDVANMIAAGEVVERPASVVKELLENAVDAGATAITVEIKKGGTQYIRVSDNGSGIPFEEIPRAFLRHATSKLQKAEHLSQIATLGFRGEALAAIAAVSKISVTSSTKEGELAHFFHLIGGELENNEEIASPMGTTMVVEDLFFNTPARKKFMKSERSEGTAIFSLTQEVALSHPEISIRFIRDDKEELKTVGDGSLESALFHVLGKNIAAGLRPIALEDLTTSVHGFVSLPSCCRGSRSFQHFFVNGRYIKSPMLMAALEEAYKNQKMVGRFPAAVLHLNLNFDEVDVNVHPAKTQVKFAHEKEIFQIVYRGVLNGLSQFSDIQKVELSNKNTNSVQDSIPRLGTVEEKSLLSIRENQMELAQIGHGEDTKRTISTEKEEKTPLFSSGSMTLASPILQERTDELAIPSATTSLPEKTKVAERELPKIDYNFADIGGLDEDSGLIYRKKEEISSDSKEESRDETPLVSGSQDVTSLSIPGEKAITTQEKKEKHLSPVEPTVDFEEIPIENIGSDLPWRVVGEFFRTYIAVEVGDEIFLVDKHAAHERMNFERLKSQNYKPMAQVLLKPIVVQVSPEEMDILMENETLLKEFSFEIEEFSLHSMIVREAPYDVDLEKVGETLVELARKLISGQFPDPTSARDHLLHSIACKSAIKAGYLTGPEEHNLLAQIVMDEKVRHCPHGRPIVASLSKKELEKRFKRIT